MSSALPPIDASVLPADVRTGSKADRTRYETGLQFERQLVEQLTQQLSDTSKTAAGGDDGEGADATTTSYRQMLPGVLADSIMAAGGLGLARTIAQNLEEGGK